MVQNTLLHLSVFVLIPYVGFGQQLQSSCEEGYILDCNNNCHPSNWIGDAVCDNGIETASDFLCEQFNWDEDDCGISSCGEGMVYDCNSNCVAIFYLGDGNCNQTDELNFSCSAFDYDAGDCAEGCAEGMILDCFDNCFPSNWVGDEVCDNGYDVPSNFWCEAFNWDEGDCGISSCGEGLVLDADSNCVTIESLYTQDCEGNNIPVTSLSLLNNWHCNDGVFAGGYVASNSFNLNCEAFEYDGGDCLIPACMDPNALNFYEHANMDDGSCIYETENTPSYPDQLLEQISLPGTSPKALCVLPQGDRAYVGVSNGIVQLSLGEENEAPVLIPTNGLIYSCASSLDGNYVYAANWTQGTIDVFDTSTNSIIESINAGSGTLKVKTSTNGQWVAASNHNSNSVTIINAQTFEVITQLAVGETPRNIDFSNDDAFFYVANWTSWTLGVYETDSWTLVTEVAVDYWPQAVCALPGDDYVLVGNFGFDLSYDHISVVRTSDWQVIARLQVGAGPEDIDYVGANGEYIYVSNWGHACCFYTIEDVCCSSEVDKGTLTIIETPNFDAIPSPSSSTDELPYLQSTVSTVHLEGEYSFGMAVHPNFSEVYVANKLSNTVSVVGFDESNSSSECIDAAACGYDPLTSLCVYAGEECELFEGINGIYTNTCTCVALASTCDDYQIVLNSGWNMIGYGCDTNVDAEIVFSSIVNHLIIAKDGNGNAYLPQWGFNGLGSLTRGYGYQIKVDIDITDYNICDY